MCIQGEQDQVKGRRGLGTLTTVSRTGSEGTAVLPFHWPTLPRAGAKGRDRKSQEPGGKVLLTAARTSPRLWGDAAAHTHTAHSTQPAASGDAKGNTSYSSLASTHGHLKRITYIIAQTSKPKTNSRVNLLLMDTYCTLSSKLIIIFDGWKKEQREI